MTRYYQDSPLNDSWVQTYTGKAFCYRDPKPDMICIEDIAHQLAMSNRFSGATHYPYSVAQHSVLVSEMVPKKHALHALLHDAPEAVMHDINTPLKTMITIPHSLLRTVNGILHNQGSRHAIFDYSKIYADVENMIFQKYNLPTGPLPKAIKLADARMLATEKRDLFPVVPRSWRITNKPYKNVKIVFWGFNAAKENFLDRFKELTGSYLG